MTTEELLRDWLGAATLSAEELNEAVQAISVVEYLLGHKWIDDYLSGWGRFDRGGRWIHTLRQLARLGELLALAADSLRFKRSILNRLRRSPSNLSAVWSELLAAEPFLRAGMSVEFEPRVLVAGVERVADFTVTDHDGPVFAEVMRPSASAAQVAISKFIDGAGDFVNELEPGWQCTLVLRRLPEPEERDELRRAVESAVRAARRGLILPEQTIGELARIELVPETTGTVSKEGQRYARGFGPLLFMCHWLGSMSILPLRAFVCAVAFKDRRAIAKMREEAMQLPDGVPSLLVVDTSETAGVAQAWPAAVESALSAESLAGEQAPQKPSAVWFIGESIMPEGLVRLTRPVFVANSRAPTLPPTVAGVIHDWSASAEVLKRYEAPRPQFLVTSVRGVVEEQKATI